MKTGKILLFRGIGLVSALIRWQTRGDYSHAALLMPNGTTIIESWQGIGCGVQQKEIADWRGVDTYDVHGLTTEQWAVVDSFARSQLGKPYDYFGCVRFLDRRKLPHDLSHWFCSELVFAAFQAAGVELLARCDASDVSPAMLSLSPLLELAYPYKRKTRLTV